MENEDDEEGEKGKTDLRNASVSASICTSICTFCQIFCVVKWYRPVHSILIGYAAKLIVLLGKHMLIQY